MLRFSICVGRKYLSGTALAAGVSRPQFILDEREPVRALL
jgi:hypothetical protein